MVHTYEPSLQDLPHVSAMSTFQRLHCLQDKDKYPVRFHALYTDGGMDDSSMIYWVGVKVRTSANNGVIV